MASGWLVLLSSEALLLTAVDGSRVAFDPAAAKANVVLFVSTVCPVSNGYHQRIVELWSEFGSRRDTRFLVVYPNKTESLEDIRRHAAEMRFPFAVFRDAGQALADRAGARFTPTAAVMAGRDGGAVRYLGAIDDAVNPARVKRRYLRDAIRATLAGRRPGVTAAAPYG